MSYVKVEYPREQVCLITLNRPERMNAMAFDVMVPFKEALDSVSFNNDIRVVIVTGAGEGFCSGADLEDPGWLDIFNGLTVPGIARRAMKILDDVIKTIHDMHQPVIGAINGAAIGGGFCLAMATDIRLASERAYFRPAGINNGLTSAELGLSYLLPRAIGTSRAFEIMLTGRDVDALEAAELGIISRAVHPENLLEECYAIAERICGFSQLGVELSKQMLWAGVDAGSLHTHMNHEGHAQLFVRMTTQNFEEAIKARKEGRRPDYKD
ncbi:enoyl-CoA hydratase [Pseudohalioglobus sediminis]|uniref:Enoyl-CoA hydratase n=1 Tax=Pseudohalioglobus sediminis TaxID=2606449 RepID=A0A5B0WR32_9GAMM|nr:enoyl-CoA hydratase [Pseudohalioglobus sediminis]KAA1188379.1 enoyl-CoA hydratase [Pseudohalioglobus sediminis]